LFLLFNIDEINAEMLRKKKCVEYQKMEENKLSLAQINGRLAQLRDKRDELEEEKMTLINQMRDDDIVSKQQMIWYLLLKFYRIFLYFVY